MLHVVCRNNHEFINSARGQTLQDFAVGVSVFLLTAAFVFTLFPSFLSPFSYGTTGGERAQAEQIARTMVLNLSTDEARTELNATRLETVLDSSQDELRNRYGLGRTAGINVTVRVLDGQDVVKFDGQRLATPVDKRNRSAASVSRIVTLDNETICRPACRLVVEVW